MIAGSVAAMAALLFFAPLPASAEGVAPLSGLRGIALSLHAQPTAEDDKIAAYVNPCGHHADPG
jgi:hypothetical protein